MNNTLNQNLTAIRIKSPRSATFLETYSINETVEITYNTHYKPFCKRKGLALHSFYDPEKEAHRICDNFVKENPPLANATLYILGCGLFYHVREFAAIYQDLVIYETDIDLLQTVLSSFDYTDILSKCRLIVFPEHELKDCFLATKTKIIYKHSPSYRMDEIKYDHFINQLSTSNGYENIKLKILLAGPVYGGSLPIYHYCKKALEELGHEVIGLDFSIHHQSMQFYDQITNIPANRQKLMSSFAKNLAETISISAIENEVDLVLGLAQAPFTPETILELKKREIVTAFWFVEDFRTLLYWQNYANLYDYFFVIQKDEFFKELKKIGCQNYYYLPTAADPDIHCKHDLTEQDIERYGSDLSFVGAGYYNRRRAFLSLLSYDFKIWGNDWQLHTVLASLVQDEGRRISTDETIKIFNASTINLNLHSSSYIEDVNPDGDFINPRTFEIASSQNFQLVDRRSLLTELYDEDEIAAYSDLDELKTKIDFYLANPQERSKIINKSYQKTITKHTYKHRMQELLNIVIANQPKLQNKTNWSGNRAQLIDKAEKAGLPELVAIFKSIDDEQISLNKITNHFKSQKKPLDRTSGIFLMMQEFWNFAKRKNLM